MAFNRNLSSKNRVFLFVLTALLLAGAAILVLPMFVGNSEPVKSGEPEPEEKGEVPNGFIQGRLDFPGEVFPEHMRVFAYNIDTRESYTVPSRGFKTYKIEVPPGRYHVYAYLELLTGYFAYYNEYVAGGMTSCGQGKPIEVVVHPGQVTDGIDPIDWDHYIDDSLYERHG